MPARVERITDFGLGDSGKGTLAHYRCYKTKAHHVVRTGGSQAFHSMMSADGRSYIHSQLGSATILEVPTHLSSNMIIEPYKLLEEGRGVMRAFGMTDRQVFDLLTIDENALAVVPFQAIANRIFEIARGDNPHGTVGIGIGETVMDSELFPDQVVRVKDFGKPWLRDKIAAIRERKIQELAPVIDNLESLPEEARRRARIDLDKLFDEGLIDAAVAEFNYVAQVVAVVDSSYLGEILDTPGTVVFEPSQGVLLDRWYGWNPYTTMARPMPEAADELLQMHNFQGEIKRLGVIRAYQTRHGAGPFVTENAELTEILPDIHNGANEWQGRFRVGHLDTVAIRYAIAACGGPEMFDGLVVTCLDQMRRLDAWQLCDRYEAPQGESGLESYFGFDSQGLVADLKVRSNTRDQAQLDRQEELGRLLRGCKPVLSGMTAPAVGSSPGTVVEAYKSYLRMIQEKVQIPIVLVSLGPTEQDKFETI